MRKLTLLILIVLMLAPMAAGLRAEPKKTLEFDELVAKLKDTSISKVSFKEESLDTVMMFLSEAGGVNFIVTDRVLEQEITVTLTLNDGISLYGVMKILGKLKGVKYYFDMGMVIVLMEDDYSMDETQVKVYDLSIAKPVRPTNFPGPELGFKRGQGSGDSYYEDEQEEEELTPEDIVEMIQKFTGGQSWEKNSENVMIKLRGETLVVKQTADVLREIDTLLEQLSGGY